MAILSGLLAHTLVETLSLGPVAPFDAASVVMLFGGVIVLFTWPENYGDSTNKRSFLEQLGSGAKAITQGKEKYRVCWGTQNCQPCAGFRLYYGLRALFLRLIDRPHMPIILYLTKHLFVLTCSRPPSPQTEP